MGVCSVRKKIGYDNIPPWVSQWNSALHASLLFDVDHCEYNPASFSFCTHYQS